MTKLIQCLAGVGGFMAVWIGLITESIPVKTSPPVQEVIWLVSVPTKFMNYMYIVIIIVSSQTCQLSKLSCTAERECFIYVTLSLSSFVLHVSTFYYSCHFHCLLF